MSIRLSSEEMDGIAKAANNLVKTLFEVTQESTDPEEQVIIMIAVQYILKKSLILNFDMLGQSEQGKKAIEIVEKYLEENGTIRSMAVPNNDLN